MYSISGTFKNNYEDYIQDNEYSLSVLPSKTSTLIVGHECNDGRPITESYKYKYAVKHGIPIISSLKKKKPQIATIPLVKELLVDKYKPKGVGDMIGHKEQINQIAKWLQEWDTKIPEVRGILVSGPPGIGKTTTVHIVAKELGYSVAEYNASDTRSASVLKGLFALGIKRLKKEIIVMDEVDGLSDRGGVGEIAAIIKKTNIPIICIANEKPPKLKPLISVCIDVRFSRPVKSTIATALFKVAQKEGIGVTKSDIESLCEQNGNDIRGILNGLDFNKSGDISHKDSTLRLDLFSATQKLIGNTRCSLDDSSNLVSVDYGMIPLMVSEAYINSSKDSLENVIAAADMLSVGDIIDRRIHTKHDWALLPNYMMQVVGAARTVKGPAPFQIFPQWLGKNSKRLKHKRWVEELGQKLRCSPTCCRLDIMDSIQHILLDGLASGTTDIKSTISLLDELGLSRDDLIETISEVSMEKIEVPTRIKTAFTREYNKLHDVKKNNTKNSVVALEVDQELEDLEGSDEIEEEVFYD